MRTRLAARPARFGRPPSAVASEPEMRTRAAAAAPARALGAVLATVAVLAGAAPVLAHGGVVPPEPTLATLLFGWTFDPTVWLPAIVALIAWRWAVGKVNREHPNNPVPRARSVSWTAGIVVLVVALDSGLALYDTTLFSLHMIQHLLLTLVAPPLLLYAGPITLLLRVSSPETRKRWILPFLHSRVIRALSFPVVAWILFAAVMWGTHFSPLFNLSLEDPLVHRFEHALFLGAGLLFWWPVIGPDPSPWRLSPAVKVFYVGLQMPQNTFLALAIYMATTPLYSHYVTTIRSWGPTPLSDQQLAGGIMWLGGDVGFLTEVFLLTWLWMRFEERRTATEDRRLDAERAALREREVLLAARRSAEAATGGPEAGPGG